MSAMLQFSFELRGKLRVAGTFMPGAGGGGGGYSTKFYIRGGSALRSKPLPFYMPFLTEKVPLSYTFHRKFYPFHIPSFTKLFI